MRRSTALFLSLALTGFIVLSSGCNSSNNSPPKPDEPLDPDNAPPY